MKRMKLIIILIVLFSITWAASASQLELGLGYTPMFNEELSDDASFQESSLINFHVGYAFWWIFYTSWDSFIIPPYIVESMTGGFDESGAVKTGYYRPGFLNMFDVGIRLAIGPVVAFGEIGANTLYVYRQGEDELDIDSGIGANIRLGAGARFGWWGLTLSVSSIQPSIGAALDIIENITSDDAYLQEQAKEMFSATLVPSLSLVLYL